MTYELIPKEIIYDEEMLNRLEQGVFAVHEAVGRTMGPAGQLVMYEEDEKIPYPIVTKDGVSVASMIAFEDQAKNNGAQFVIQAARKQVIETGDGTTLTSILTYKIFKEGRKLISAGYQPNEIINGIKRAVEDVVKDIKNNCKSNVTLNDLRSIARVSTNNDRDLADKIAEAVHKTGKHGLVFQERSLSDEHEVEYQDGYQLNIGILAREFANKDTIMHLESPYIIVTDQIIASGNTLLPILTELCAIEKNPKIVLIAPQISGDVLQMMKRNITDKEGGQFFMVHIKPTVDLKPEKNRMIMEDLAAATGSLFVSQSSGYQIDKLNIGQLGTCDTITSYPEKTLITGFSDEADKRVKLLKEELKTTEDKYKKDLIEESIAKLSGGVATIKVGGRNLTEQSETLFRVDDAVRACKSAQEMGYVRGGGVAMLESRTRLDREDHSFGYRLVMDCLKYPTEVILKNAKREDWQSIISAILYDNKKGYDIRGKVFVDMYKLNIIDPTKVVVYAIKNAASAAISMLQTSVMIIGKNEVEDK